MNDRAFLEALKEYTEDVENQIEGEWGMGRSLESIIAQNDMPEVYAEVLRRLATPTLQERLYRLMADAGALAPDHTWPGGVLDDYIVGWVQGLQSKAAIANRTRELEQELERSYQVAADLRADLDVLQKQ